MLVLFVAYRQSVPVQFQYFLPTYPPSAYPLTAHTYTPITSSVSTIRQYPGKRSSGASRGFGGLLVHVQALGMEAATRFVCLTLTACHKVFDFLLAEGKT